MLWFKKRKTNTYTEKYENPKSVHDLLNQLKDNPDFTHYKHVNGSFSCWISFFSSLINVESVHRDVLPYLYGDKIHSLADIHENVPIEKMIRTSDLKEIQTKLMVGCLLIQIRENSNEVLLVPSVLREGRQIEKPEIETSIIGAKEAFVEAIDTNISLIRKRIPIPQFTVEELRVGKISNTRVCISYIKGIANEENINTARQRIKDLEVDHLIDTSTLSQLISDNARSPFPVFIDTERPDRTTAGLYEGKIALLVDGSPNALIIPTTLIEFFNAFDDYFVVWHFATAFRLLRLFAVAFSVLSSAVYVAILSFHYQLVPTDLLGTLITSRSVVPFSPMVEALILEIMIELLREAGARLPTKVGQTMGIVGGIVIGTASVQAGLTSNVLLILVAMSALAAFTTPNYRMGTSIRFLRFPFIIAANIWGLLGITICFTFFVCHLLRLTSLGRPFIEPIYPLRLTDLKDSFIRFPYSNQSERPMFLRPGDPSRFDRKRSKKRAGIQQNDIDE